MSVFRCDHAVTGAGRIGLFSPCLLLVPGRLGLCRVLPLRRGWLRVPPCRRRPMSSAPKRGGLACRWMGATPAPRASGRRNCRRHDQQSRAGARRASGSLPLLGCAEPNLAASKLSSQQVPSGTHRIAQGRGGAIEPKRLGSARASRARSLAW